MQEDSIGRIIDFDAIQREEEANNSVLLDGTRVVRTEPSAPNIGMIEMMVAQAGIGSVHMKGMMGLFTEFIKTPATQAMLGVPMGVSSFTTPHVAISAPIVVGGISTIAFKNTTSTTLPTLGCVSPTTAPPTTTGQVL